MNEALRRIGTARKPSARGGIVWHTQGSGKSLTMLWLALKLRRDTSQQQPTVVIVTDRTKLDRQIAGVFTACGFPNPERAASVRGLRQILEHPTGKTVMTTIQKFQEITSAGGAAGRASVHPTLSEAANIFVMVDEAHRTQYQSLAANMRQALPNACFLGFTGTPIDKKDRSTLQTFGPYIDTYTIEQAVQDRATVPIFYESRLPELPDHRADHRSGLRPRLPPAAPTTNGPPSSGALPPSRRSPARRAASRRSAWTSSITSTASSLRTASRPRWSPRAATPRSPTRRRWIG